MEFKAAQMPFDLKRENNTFPPEGGLNIHEGNWKMIWVNPE